ncbi:MAG: S-adenosylmethionine synthetase [Candidatus Altiarchaeales archaeon IMC4]|nr:MAG: S-adenosylmethionine synthetase [Candidatus Altiarchaeales archaeon IMC4]
MRNILVELQDIAPLKDQPVELVERKGIGHPDSICDGIAESVSRELSKEYVKRFGNILHHNTDQVELVGGEVDVKFGKGEVIKPIYILLSGRATTYLGSERIPVGRIALSAARDYLQKKFPNIDVDSDVIIDQRIGLGSSDLRHVFGMGGVPKSNDTSFGCGFAPFSTTEVLVFEIERFLNKKGKPKEIGEDIKVMGVRKNGRITLTVALPLVSKYVDDMAHYKSVIEETHSRLLDLVSKKTDTEVRIDLNTGDDYKKGSVYLTVTGTSAEQGDDGSVGRGNRANGIITPFRPMSMEATAGKNPVNHVGKIYNILSNMIAEDIAKEGAEQVYVRLMSQIGAPIDQPFIASVQVIGDKSIEKKAYKIADWHLENVTAVTKMCLEGKARTF